MRKIVLYVFMCTFLFCLSCSSDNDKWDVIDVPHKPCPCDEGKEMQPVLRGSPEQEKAWFLQEEAYIFKDTLPEKLPDMYQGEYFDLSISKFCIIYDTKTNDVCMYGWGGMAICLIKICNFPDNIESMIPENGCVVYFEGTMYQPCEDIFRDCCGVSDFKFNLDFILTHLKIKKK